MAQSGAMSVPKPGGEITILEGSTCRYCHKSCVWRSGTSCYQSSHSSYCQHSSSQALTLLDLMGKFLR